MRWDLPDGEAMFALVNFTPDHQTFEVKGLDGSYDALGYSKRWEKEHAFEIAFRDRAIRFSSVRVYGSAVADVKVSVRRGDAWEKVVPATTRREGLMTEVSLGKVLEASALRVTPVLDRKASDTMEIYELEVPNVRE